MKFIALLEKAKGAEMSAFAPYVEPEAEQVWKLYQQDQILELYFVEGDLLPIIVLQAASAEEARTLLNTLPMVRDELFVSRLLTLQPYDELGKRIRQSGSNRPDWWPVASF